MLHTPAGVVPESRSLNSGSFALGRAGDNDWVLPDPERVLSKRHCAISAVSGGWHLVDSSSNGTFLNGRCLDPGVPRALRDGDRIAFGAYEIEVRIVEAVEPANCTGSFDRLTSDPFPPDGAAAGHDIGLPPDFNHLGEDGIFGNSPLPAPDHVPAIGAHFKPPRVSSEMLPDDWDWDAPEDAARAALGSEPIQPEVPDPEREKARPPVLPEPPQAQPAAVLTSAAPDLARALALVAAGAGIEGTPRGAPAAALHALGQAFRALVVGLRRTMIARATIKGEFRIEQTMIQAVGNNPLKFAADDDDALAALLGVGRRSEMSAERAVAEALHDIRLHDLATAAAMQSAVRDMLDQISPARVGQSLDKEPLDAIPGRRERRAWQGFVERHAATVRAMDDDFDSVFGKAFARAYEQAQVEIGRHHTPPALNAITTSTGKVRKGTSS